MSFLSRSILLCTAGAALALCPTAAEAQSSAGEYSRWVFRAELGAGTMLHDFTHDSVNTSAIAGELSARVAFRLVEPLSIQAGAGIGRFFLPSDCGSPRGDCDDVSLIFGTGGLRLEPRIGSVGRIWLDANAGVYAVGVINRFGFDGSLGAEFFVNDTFAIGPFARYARVLDGRYSAPTNQMTGAPAVPSLPSADIDWWVAGISVAVYSRNAPAAPPPPPPPADTDHDGVNDPADQCVNEPAGDHPDPARAGCPLPDEDHDGVYGSDDQCPTEAPGEHPDASRRGCPAPDTDGDGVYGADDLCPEQAQGEHPNPERRGCPDGDADHDGVLDHADQCRDQAAGLHPDPARAGCPAPDGDNDNVPDAVDRCPTQPGAPSSNPARNGCPGLLVIQDGAMRILRPVFFANNSDRILPTSNALLTAVADALRTTPEIRRMTVEGHTDDVGDDAANLDLSRRRAVAVVTWLTTRGQVEAARLTAEGLGETRPLTPVAGITGRALNTARGQNRRVEFRITEVGH